MHKRSLVREIGYWKKYTELHMDPEVDFLYRAELNGSTFVIAKNVTAFKFPSALRPDSYRERRCDEQADYARRIQTEPDRFRPYHKIGKTPSAETKSSRTTPYIQ
jgi:hypothetical protein